jgi:nitrite reductase/ring-hydroxylating ferredoxin subunit
MWQKVAKVSDFDSQPAQRIKTEAVDVAVFKKDGTFHAIANTCAHRGASLVEGHMDGLIVTCPWHAWQFDVKTGACQNIAGVSQKIYPVKVSGGDVLVDLGGAV